VIKGTASYTVAEYLSRNPEANNPSSRDFSVGGNDVMNITVYEEPDLTRENIRVSADGYISFPFINRVKVEGLTSSEIEELISTKLAEGQYLLNAHVSVSVQEFNSKQYLVLGSVKNPGSYPLQGNDRVLDAISRSGGIDFEQGGKQAMIVRTENPGTEEEEKIVIQIELGGLLKGGDQRSNLLLADNDLLYIPKAENFYILGQVKNPGSYPYLEKDITLVEAISKAGGFTPIAARNRTRIIRIEDGVEKVIQVKVDVITQAGRKAQDIRIQPGDVIVIPESFF
jgi:polysaccharide export outer membrane protein